jgi:alpha-tubulin suppressor-like RCC1 family protein
MPTPTDAVDVATGPNGRCAVSAAGGLYCSAGGSTLNKVTGVDDATGVSVSVDHTCFVRKTGVVQCRGRNPDGQLGFIDLSINNAPFADVPDILDAVAVKTGRVHTCVLRKTGHVACFGRVAQGWLGTGPEPTDRALRTRPGVIVEVKGLDDAIALGEGGACAIRKGGAPYCWGENTFGGVGDGTLEDAYLPVAVKGVSSVTQIARGWRSTCAVDLNGDLQCWGDLSKFEPKKVKGLSDATALVLSRESAYASRPTGGIVFWGRDERPALAQNKPVRSVFQPEVRYDLSDVTALAARDGGLYLHDLCALRSTGEVQCFSRDTSFKPGITDAAAIALSLTAGCALRKGGGVACWGNSTAGECGPDATDAVSKKKAVDIAIQDAVSIAASAHSMCAIRSNHTVACWGSSTDGILGNGAAPDLNKHGTPTPVVNLNDAVSLAMSSNQACAVRKTGEVVCWGKNEQHLVDDPPRMLKEPVSTHINDAISVFAAADKGFCALRSNGKTTCWGMPLNLRGGGAPNEDGYSDLPLSDLTALSFGKSFGCALQKGGQALCWGEDESGQIGAGDGRGVVTFPHH